MALIRCSECGKEVSDKAGSCPGCGAPIATQLASAPKSKTGCFTWFVAGILGFGLLSALIAQRSGERNATSATSTATPATSLTAAPTIDKSEEKQTGRKKLISDLQARGVLGKVACRDAGATAIVGSSFYPLDFETKQSFIGVIYAYCFEGSDSYVVVTLKDISTNKKVGTFSKESGLEFE